MDHSATDEAISSFMRASRPRAVEWLRDLVATGSQSPDEAKAQVLVAEIARSVDLRADLLDSDPSGDLAGDRWHIDTGLGYENRPNCVVTVPTASGAPMICNAHIDTVAAGSGWTRSPQGELVGGRFYGLGAADTKASTVSALLASACLLRLGIEPAMPIELHSVIDEEPGGNGSLAMVREWSRDRQRPQLVVVMEPSRLDVLTGHRGMLWHRIECHGVQAHGSSGSGVNAIEIASEVVLRLRDLNAELATWSTDGFPAPIVNVGIMVGGHEAYTTPGTASIDVSTRYAPDQKHQVLDAITRALAEVPTGERRTVEIDLVSDFDAAATLKTDPAVASLLAEVRRRHPSSSLGTLAGTCDMRHYVRELGVPTVIFGPGDLAVAHAADEYVDIDEILVAANALAALSARGLSTDREGKRFE